MHRAQGNAGAAACASENARKWRPKYPPRTTDKPTTKINNYQHQNQIAQNVAPDSGRYWALVLLFVVFGQISSDAS
jgi:hypothetical protein